MLAEIIPHNLMGEVSAIGSKSFAHRALIAAAFFQKTPTVISGVTLSADVLATIGCLRALGVSVQGEQNLLVTPAKCFPQRAVLDCGNSGSTYRFLLPVVAALGISAEFVLSKRLSSRPIEALVKTLGACCNADGTRVCGKLACGTYHVDGSVSSQFVSGMLFALSLLPGSSRLFVDGKKVSQGYVDATACVLRKFGASVQKTNFGFEVCGGIQTERENYAVEGDWSNAAYFLAAGALSGDVTVCGLNVNSVQPDRAIVDVLRSCGAMVSTTKNGVCVQKGSLHAFQVDASQIPDLVPTLAVLAAFCSGTSVLSGVERLRQKESDRVQNAINTLREAGIEAVCCNNQLIVHGAVPHGGNFFADNDHRVAMSQTLLALCAKGNSTISGCECVDKSYPNFFSDVKKLGGENCVCLERS